MDTQGESKVITMTRDKWESLIRHIVRDELPKALAQLDMTTLTHDTAPMGTDAMVNTQEESVHATMGRSEDISSLGVTWPRKGHQTLGYTGREKSTFERSASPNSSGESTLRGGSTVSLHQYESLKRDFQMMENTYKSLQKEQHDLIAYCESLEQALSLGGTPHMGLLDRIKGIFSSQQVKEDEKNRQHTQQVNTLHKQIEETHGNLSNLERKYRDLEGDCRQWKEQYETVIKDLQSLKAEHAQLCNELGTVQNYNKELKERLEAGFGSAEGLLMELQQLPSIYVEQLKGMIKFDSLRAFIVSSASDERALERIWDTAYDALAKYKDTPSFTTLWTYFEFACDLYNTGRKQQIYSLCDTKEGDTYNLHDVDSDDTSAPRGHITKVHMRGFKNSYIDKTIRKSYVHVG